MAPLNCFCTTKHEVTATRKRTDSLTPDQRRRAMQSNRGRTKPERRVASALWRSGFRFLSSEGYRTLSGRRFLGSPDLILVRQRCVIFVDGCFWHGCQKCHDFRKDLSPSWQEKIRANVLRDRRNRARLRSSGWTVLVVREHNLTSEARFAREIRRVIERIARNSPVSRSRYPGLNS